MEGNVAQKERVRGLAGAAAVALIGAGVIHLVLVPGHGLEAPVHGLVYGLSGVVEIVLGIALLLRPSQGLYRAALAMALALIGLWALTRVLPAPFGHGPEAVDAGGVACKLCEAVAVVAAAALIVSGARLGETRFAAWQRVTGIALVALLLAGALYGVGRAAEPLFPSLVATESGSHQEGGADVHEEPGTHGGPEDHGATAVPADTHPH